MNKHSYEIDISKYKKQTKQRHSYSIIIVIYSISIVYFKNKIKIPNVSLKFQGIHHTGVLG
jgi:hypothetical protein